MSGNIFGCHTSGERCYWPLAGGARGAAARSTTYRAAPRSPLQPPTAWNDLAANGSSAAAEKARRKPFSSRVPRVSTMRSPRNYFPSSSLPASSLGFVTLSLGFPPNSGSFLCMFLPCLTSSWAFFSYFSFFALPNWSIQWLRIISKTVWSEPQLSASQACL